MCLITRTRIPIPHFTLFRGKKVYKQLDLRYKEDDNINPVGYKTPIIEMPVPKNGVLVPIRNPFAVHWAWDEWEERWCIYGGYIHCHSIKKYNDEFEAVIPPFTLYFKGDYNDIACKKLIVTLPALP